MLAAHVKSGLDVLNEQNCGILKNKKVALLINANSVTAGGEFTVGVLKRNSITVKKIFSPEHGLSADVDSKVGNSTYSGIPVVSLYGKRRDFSKGDLDGIDILVFDIQDAGARYYTYLATMVYSLKASKSAGIRVIVLDRPNPVGGEIVSGFVPDKSLTGYYTSIYPIPTRHGMTIGELALYYNRRLSINADLEVVRMEGYDRSMLYSDTGLAWRNPSPNLRSEEAALLYSGIGWLETTSLSMARGLPDSFEKIGAPYIDGAVFARELMKTADTSNITIKAVSFIPTAPGHKYAGKRCGGISISIKNKKKFDGFALSLAIFETLKRLYPDDFSSSSGTRVSAGIDIEKQINRGRGVLEKEAAIQNSVFMRDRAEFLLYR